MVSNGSDVKFTGEGIYFIKLTNKAITTQNINQEVYFGKLSASILPSLSSMVKHIIMPALQAQVKYYFIINIKNKYIYNIIIIII